MSCKASSMGYKDKQQRIEDLCSMATALSGRIENEARRLGVEADVWKRPGSQSWDKGWERADLRGFTRADPMGNWTDHNDPKRQLVPSPEPVPSPRVSLCDFLPARHQEWEEQQGAAVPEDEMVDEKLNLQDDHPEDGLLCSSLLKSECNIQWSDSESLMERGLCSRPRVIDNALTGKQK
eukprot:g26984.t1